MGEGKEVCEPMLSPEGWRPRSRRSFKEVLGCQAYHECLPAVADLISSVTSRNAKTRPSSSSPFDGTRPAPISVKDFLVRMCKYGHCSPSTFITMVVYLDRLNASADIHLSPLNVHRLMLVAFVLSVKSRDDTLFSNAHYAFVGGITVAELNSFERLFLNMINFDLWTGPAEHETYVTQLHLRLDRLRTRASTSQPTSPLRDQRTPQQHVDCCTLTLPAELQAVSP